MNRPPRFGAVIPVLNEFRFLPAVVGQLLKVCDRVLLMRSVRPFSGGRPVRLRPLPSLPQRVEIVQGAWISEEATRNRGIEILGGGSNACEYIFTVDSDEILTLDALQLLKQHIARGHHAVACYFDTYWKSPEWMIWPPDRNPATVIVRRDQRFKLMRVLEAEPNIIRERLVHHLSYVRTDEELIDKLKFYGHAHQIMSNWYENVWKRWDDLVLTDADLSGFVNFHPINPGSFATAKKSAAHELGAILREHGVA